MEKTQVIRLSPSPLRAAAVLSAVLLAALLTACGSSGDGDATPSPADSATPPAAQETAPAAANLTAEQAIAAAISGSAHILQDRTPQQTSAALDGGVWTVTLKGTFYEPAQPNPVETPRPGELRCAEVIVLVDDATAQYTRLTFQQAGGC